MIAKALPSIATFLLVAFPAYAIESACSFTTLQPVTCDGTDHKVAITLPTHIPKPTRIVSAFVQFHTGVAPLVEIGGLFDMTVQKPTGPVHLLATMNRHGVARWQHQPPVVLSAGEAIMVQYGCQTRALTWWERRLTRYSVLPATIMPEVELCWSEP